MVFLIVYLNFNGLVSLVAFIRLLIFVLSMGVFHIFLWSLYWTKYLFLFIKKQPLEDLLQNSCSKSVLKELKYACESVLFLLKLQAIGLLLSITITTRIPAWTLLHALFFSNRSNTKNNYIYFCRTPSMADSVHSLNPND